MCTRSNGLWMVLFSRAAVAVNVSVLSPLSTVALPMSLPGGPSSSSTLNLNPPVPSPEVTNKLLGVPKASVSGLISNFAPSGTSAPKVTATASIFGITMRIARLISDVGSDILYGVGIVCCSGGKHFSERTPLVVPCTAMKGSSI